MGLTFEPLGKYVRQVDERNTNMVTESVLGINIDKYFMPSVANVIGTDLSNYKLLRKGRFACNPMHVGRDGRLPVSRYTEDTSAIVSPAYFMFEIIDENEIEPEYLMLCFRRPNFARKCWVRTDASVRGGITWDDVCALTIPVPSLPEQRKIVHDYQVITDRIELLRKMNENLVWQCDTIYRALTVGRDTNGKLAEIASVHSGKRPKNMESGDIPLLGAGGIMRYISAYNYDTPSLVIGRVGTHGVVQRSSKFWASDNTLVIVPKYYEFVFHILRGTDYASLNRGSTQPLITQGDIKALDIYIPEKEELDTFEQKTSSIMKCNSEYQKEIELLERVQMLVISHIS